jgi:hypothetical protein
MRAKVATSRYYTIATNSGRQHWQATLSRSLTFTFQRIPTRAQAKEPEQQEGGIKSIKEPNRIRNNRSKRPNNQQTSTEEIKFRDQKCRQAGGTRHAKGTRLQKTQHDASQQR